MAPPMADLPAEPTELHSDRGVFRAEYERELGTWLRRRLGHLCLVYAAFQILSVVVLLVAGTLLGDGDGDATEAIGERPAPIEAPA